MVLRPGLREVGSATVVDHAAIARSLLDERTGEKDTTGRRSQTAPATEIWTTVVDGTTYICGTPMPASLGSNVSPGTDWPTWWRTPISSSG
jgi:hypothetical protein